MARRGIGIAAAVVALVCGATLTGCDVVTTVAPVADAFVDATTPATSYGADGQLVVDADPLRQAFLQFDLTALEGTVLDARLRLHVADLANAGSSRGGTVARVTGGWTEGDVTYDSRPTTWGLAAGEIGAVTPNTWVELTVTSAVSVGGVLTLGIRSDSTDGAYYDSREHGTGAPELIVTTGAKPAAVTGTTVAAVGDLACAPGNATTATGCRQVQVSDDLVADTALTEVLALGDLQYENGELASFRSSYQASYGRLLDKTRPMPGNHEYNTTGAAGYYAYFGAAAGDPTKGYYSFDVGTAWHVVVLNSNCSFVGCEAGSPQEQWLRADLEASTRPCTIAAWHHPRFTSSEAHSDEPTVAPFWDALQADGAELVLNGHTHSYERYAPQRPDGTADPKGIREIIVGTGGKSQHGFAAADANSKVRLLAFGYLRLVLGAKSYSWQFLDESGVVRDAGTGTCR